jgi:hypothetical protein
MIGRGLAEARSEWVESLRFIVDERLHATGIIAQAEGGANALQLNPEGLPSAQ